MAKYAAPLDYALMTPAEIVADIRARRDAKLSPVLAAHLPAWIIAERINSTTHVCTFDVVFRPDARWQQRRYTYDAEVDVLHYRGAQPFTETQLAALTPAMVYQPPLSGETGGNV